MSVKFYNKRVIKTGGYIELYEHEKPISYGHTCKIKGGRQVGSTGKVARSKEYRERGYKQSKNKLIRLINTNFSTSNFVKFITLTFRDHSIPDLTDIKRANQELKKYLRKLRDHCGKLKYVSVIEFQDKNKR